MFQTVMTFITTHVPAIAAGALFIVNEVFAWSPKLQSNSILQFLVNVLKSVGSSGSQQPPAPPASSPKP